MTEKEVFNSTFEQKRVDKREAVYETAHEVAPPIQSVRAKMAPAEKKEARVLEKKPSPVFNLDEFEDDEEEEGIVHPENHHRFPLERKFFFYFGLTLLVVPVLLVTPTPFPSWLLFPILSPVAVFFMAFGVGKKHAEWHVTSVPRKIRIGLKNFIRGILG